MKPAIIHWLKTVLENSSLGHASAPEDEVDQWEQSFMFREEHENTYINKWNKGNWCRPSCVPISVILVLIVLVVLVPLLDHSPSIPLVLHQLQKENVCYDKCRFSLVESLPSGLIFPADAVRHEPTTQAWLDLINRANNTIEIASFYWSIRENELYPHNSSKEGEQIFRALLNAGTKRKIEVKIVQSVPTKANPNTDTEILVKKKAAEVRSVNFPKLLGGGVLHTKLWLVDRIHFYVGSANMDWRSLTQVKELGAVAYNCSCLAEDIGKIFDVYWSLGAADASIPDSWPDALKTDYNDVTPLNISYNGLWYNTYMSSSPPPLCPSGRTADINSITETISSAEKFVYIAVMDYFPLTLFKPSVEFWPIIDDAIRKAAVQNKVKIRMLISWWKHSRPSEDYFLRSLTALTKSFPRVDIQVKRFVMPATEDEKRIPFARVNHNKYMVTDTVAYIGTSNWSADYFADTAGVGLVVAEQDEQRTNASIRAQLQAVFERDWSSPHAIPLVE